MSLTKQTSLIATLMVLALPVFAQQKNSKQISKTHVAKKATPPVFIKASYPGGQKGIDSFLSVSLRYPEYAKEAGVQGRVVVKFLVDDEGRVVDPKVMRGIGAGCDEEAKRVVASMHGWQPATYGKKRVKMMFTLPISFRIE